MRQGQKEFGFFVLTSQSHGNWFYENIYLFSTNNFIYSPRYVPYITMHAVTSIYSKAFALYTMCVTGTGND